MYDFSRQKKEKKLDYLKHFAREGVYVAFEFHLKEEVRELVHGYLAGKR